jgi:hypothetical protein
MSYFTANCVTTPLNLQVTWLALELPRLEGHEAGGIPSSFSYCNSAAIRIDQLINKEFLPLSQS